MAVNDWSVDTEPRVQVYMLSNKTSIRKTVKMYSRL